MMRYETMPMVHGFTMYGKLIHQTCPRPAKTHCFTITDEAPCKKLLFRTKKHENVLPSSPSFIYAIMSVSPYGIKTNAPKSIPLASLLAS